MALKLFTNTRAYLKQIELEVEEILKTNDKLATQLKTLQEDHKKLSDLYNIEVEKNFKLNEELEKLKK